MWNKTTTITQCNISFYREIYMKQQLVCNNTYKCTKKDFHDSFQQQQQLYHIPTKFMCIGLSPLNVASFSFLGPILSFKLLRHS